MHVMSLDLPIHFNIFYASFPTFYTSCVTESRILSVGYSIGMMFAPLPHLLYVIISQVDVDVATHISIRDDGPDRR